MGVEARCRPCHSTAHCRHMKRQPFLCNGCPCRGRRHCNCRHHLRCHRQLRPCCRRCHRRRCRCPSPLPLPSAIAIVVAINHRRRHLCHVAISNCCRRRPRRQPLLSPSPLAIAVAISVGHHCCHCRWPFPSVVALARRTLYSNNLSKECSPYFICSDSGRCTDQSQMTDQVSSGDGQHQRWAASGKQ